MQIALLYDLLSLWARCLLIEVLYSSGKVSYLIDKKKNIDKKFIDLNSESKIRLESSVRINRLWNGQNSDVIANNNQVVGLVHVFKLAPNLVVLEHFVFCILFKFYLPLDLSLVFLQFGDFVVFDLFLKSQILSKKWLLN